LLPDVAVQGWRHQGRVRHIADAAADRGGGAGGGDRRRRVHDVPLPLLGSVVKSSWGEGSLCRRVGALPQDSGTESLLLLLGALQKLEVNAVGLQMVSVVWLDSVEALGLQRGALTEGKGESSHPAHASGDILPSVARDGQGNLFILSVVESRGGEHTVAELETADIEHGQVQQLHDAGEGEARVSGERERVVVGSL